MTTDPTLADALASVHDAGALRVPPHLAVATAVATAGGAGIGAAIDWLVAHRDALEAAYAAGGTDPLRLAAVPPEMQYQPELAWMDFERRDHVVRERRLFADVVGRRTFFQTAVYAITGLELSDADALLLERLGTVNLQADVRAWPLAATRRVAARGGGYAGAVVAGAAMMGGTVVAGAAAADCARFLRRADAAAGEGRPVADLVADLLARKQRVMGFGRPVVGPDERVPVMERLLRDAGRAELRFVTLLREAEAAFDAARGLRTTSAAWAAAILSDFGMTPVQVHAVSNFWVMVCVYAHAAFADQHRLVPPAP